MTTHKINLGLGNKNEFLFYENDRARPAPAGLSINLSLRTMNHQNAKFYIGVPKENNGFKVQYDPDANLFTFIPEEQAPFKEPVHISDRILDSLIKTNIDVDGGFWFIYED